MQRTLRKMRRRKILLMEDVSLTPLIDTALTLLIIFMITAPMMQNSILVNLPKGDVKEADTSIQELVVSVNKKGQLSFNSIPMNEKQIIGAIRHRIKDKANNKMVIIKADKDAYYGKVISIVDSLKHIEGVENVALVTQRFS